MHTKKKELGQDQLLKNKSQKFILTGDLLCMTLAKNWSF